MNTMLIADDEKAENAIIARIPAGRGVKAEDLKGSALYLASEVSNYVSGEVLTVDGGWMGK